jgi:transposase
LGQKAAIYARVAKLKQSSKLFMDVTTAPVLDPGRGKTKPGYFWALARDDRPWLGQAPPSVAFTYAPGRGGKYADDILQGFGGILQVDGYAGYNRLFKRASRTYNWPIVGRMHGESSMMWPNSTPPRLRRRA